MCSKQHAVCLNQHEKQIPQPARSTITRFISRPPSPKLKPSFQAPDWADEHRKKVQNLAGGTDAEQMNPGVVKNKNWVFKEEATYMRQTGSKKVYRLEMKSRKSLHVNSPALSPLNLIPCSSSSPGRPEARHATFPIKAETCFDPTKPRVANSCSYKTMINNQSYSGKKDKSHAKYKGETKHTFPQTCRLTSSATAIAGPASRWWNSKTRNRHDPTARLKLGGRLKLLGRILGGKLELPWEPLG